MAGNSWLKKLLDPQSYGLAIVLAVILHVGVISLFAIEWPKEKRQIAEPTPRNIQAKVIQTENKHSKQRKLAAEQRRKNENWKKHLAKKKAVRDRTAKNKAAKNKAAKEQAKKLADKKKAKVLKDKALKKAENLKKTEVFKEKERLKQEKLEEKEAFEREQEADLMEALAAEEQQRSIEKALADELKHQESESVKAKYSALIREKISEAWRFPPSARPEMRVEVRFQMVPTGEVVSVTIVKSSGNEALDRSVIAAVMRAQPLPVTNDARLFEQEFRSVIMGFSPKGAVW
jgi:colicin import membrane protein